MARNKFFVAICVVCVLLNSSLCDDNNGTVCPKYCSCDLYENLNRADCSDKRLISPYIDIPNTVELLDLSNNDISSLEDRCFKDLKYILNLTISNNGIHTIFLDAFSDLVELQYIDLSHNRLEYFDPRIFENNRKLIGINLNGNKFMTMKDGPFIISPSVQYLSLHQSQIMQTTESQFAKMPLINKLDLSDNFMITLNIATFIRLGQLKYLNVLNNRWTTCHTDLKSTVEYLRAKQVQVRINVCNTPRYGEKKFEKMMMAPPSDEKIETFTERPVAVDKDISSVWKNVTDMEIMANFKCVKENLEEICSLYESCNARYNKLIIEQTINHHRTKLIDYNDRIYVALYSGLFLGSFITSSVVYVIYLICGSRYWRKRRFERKLAERRRHFSQTRNARGQPTVIPRPLRTAQPSQRPLPAMQPTRQAISRTYQREFLLSRIFERPERHRYAHYHPHIGPPNRTRSIQNSHNLDTERLIRSSPEDETTSPIALAAQQQTTATAISAHSTRNPDEFSNAELSRSNEPATTINTNVETMLEPIFMERAETPPPPYSEIIKD